MFPIGIVIVEEDGIFCSMLRTPSCGAVSQLTAHIDRPAPVLRLRDELRLWVALSKGALDQKQQITEFKHYI
jgi:hypothetical protein